MICYAKKYYAFVLLPDANNKKIAAKGNGTQKRSFNSLKWLESFPMRYIATDATIAMIPNARKTFFLFIVVSFYKSTH